MKDARFWIGVVSAEDAECARAAGYVELSGGRAGPLERMRPGDGIALYSPRLAPGERAPLQVFSAIGEVGPGPMYVTDAEAPDGEPRYRRPVTYFPSMPAPIRPLIEHLSFIRRKEHWGAAFRFGIARVPAEDFARIRAAMGSEVRDDQAARADAAPGARAAADERRRVR